MGFKQWLITERESIVLNKAIGKIDTIDFRFEDYPEDDIRTLMLKRTLMQSLSAPPFYGALPNGKFIFVRNSNADVVDQRPEDALELPSFWWEYIAGYNGNTVVKMPKKLRDTD